MPTNPRFPIDKFRDQAQSSRCQSHQLELVRAFELVAQQQDGAIITTNGPNRGASFYPPSEIKRILKLSVVKDVLRCRCEKRCERLFSLDNNRDECLALHIFDNGREMLAILIYMGVSFMLRRFLDLDFHDNNLDNADISMAGYSKWVRDGVFTHKDIESHNPSLHRQGLEATTKAFCADFHIFQKRFQPPKFQRNGIRRELGSDCVFPFLEQEKVRNQSSYGTVYKINIHKDFLVGLGSSPQGSLVSLASNHEGSSHPQRPRYAFARKELKDGVKEDDFFREKEILEFLLNLRHPNIIELYLWYRHEDLFNLVFPCYEGNLEQVMMNGWVPPGKVINAQNTGSSLAGHWLWRELVDIVSALVKLHDLVPSWTAARNARMKCGHFDLKPANILVSWDGRLVITDFGQASIKRVHEDGSSSLSESPGDLVYRPPPTETYQGRTEYRPKMSTAYDIWSMACILTEAVTFIMAGRERVCAFLNERKQEGDSYLDGGRFWSRRGSPAVLQLKEVVETWLRDQGQHALSNEYHENVISLLTNMFSIQPELRPQATECFDKLKLNAGESESRQVLSSAYPMVREGEKELCTSRITSSPLHNMDLTYSLSNVSEPAKRCRLRLFENYDSRAIRLATIITVSGLEIMEIESTHRSTEGLIPSYAFDPSGVKLSCAFRTWIYPKREYAFPSLRDLYRFQAVITSQLVIGSSDHRLAAFSVATSRWGRSGWGRSVWDHSKEHTVVQLWKELEVDEHKEMFDQIPPPIDRISQLDVTRRQQGTLLTSTLAIDKIRTPAYRIVIFRIEHNDFFTIPLHHNNVKVIRCNKSKSDLMDTTLNSTILLECIHKDDLFRVGHFKGQNVEGQGNIPPAIPLDYKAIPAGETGKVRYMELLFGETTGGSGADNRKKFLSVLESRISGITG
ncbi:MAG: hypothetical protein M1837_000660 [Sclerophora amabilis]|nr:MAG: hypothetical protein M1837_000660 [Sclerophora amabilis]